MNSVQEELHQLIRDLCTIPAPSHREDARAAFCRDWFVKNGFEGVVIDGAKNVVCPWNAGVGKPLVVFMAHTDTVFPDTDPLPFREEGGRMYCPGVTDDTANLAVLMICARMVREMGASGEVGALFVANSCEEGLGNLKGSRQIVADYGPRIRELITLDGTDLAAVVTDAVGSHRYRVTVRTQGGHSFGNFGRANAIHGLAQVIDALYSVEVPVRGSSKTTYNVGMISGGTSVNTIAQQAEMLYEYRSDDLACLNAMMEQFFAIIHRFRAGGMDVSVQLIGDRPCTGSVDPAAQQALIDRAGAAIREVTGREMRTSSGSTDANTALAAGIPAICISACHGGGCHTREEWLDVASLADGCRLVLRVMEGELGDHVG